MESKRFPVERMGSRHGSSSYIMNTSHVIGGVVQIGLLVCNGPVQVMSSGCDLRDPTCTDRSSSVLIIGGPNVLCRTAAAADDQDVDPLLRRCAAAVAIHPDDGPADVISSPFPLN